jgi:alginate O-acetyltransferase complex protein AlgI
VLFHTPTFLVFFLAVVLCFAAAGANRTGKKLVLFLASCVFYMWWSPIFILLLLGPMLVDFNVARWLERTDDPRRRGWLLSASIFVNLGLLAFFKYATFLAQNALALLHGLGVPVEFEAPHVLLPIGISFFTFERMSYTIDVYRRTAPATHSPLDFALFISFFPRLIAGPIVRAADFLPQLRSDLPLRFDAGIFFLIVRGLAKKVVVADNLSPFVEQIFSDPAAWSSLVIWLAALAFAVQIYCDFSGYSDVALALGRVFGLELPKNFERPYFARNPSDFWRRWHISLSSWLRDYLYVSLGGNRRGRARTYWNLMVTMLLGGLWHGASWNFVLWGFLHGLALAVHRGLHDLGWLKKPGPAGGIGHVVSVLAMQYWVVLCWIPFRIADSSKMLVALEKFVLFDGNLSLASTGLGKLSPFSTALLLGGFLAIHALSARIGNLDERLAESPRSVAVAASLLAGMIFVAFWPLSDAPFIYFQF